MGYVQGTTVYSWKDSLLGKPSFKPYRLILYTNGRLLLEKQGSEKLKASGNLRDIFPYVRIGCLDSEKKRDQATTEGLTLAYDTLILPLESSTGWREREYAVSFDREIKEWMQSFAQVLSLTEQWDQVIRTYQETKKRQVNGNDADQQNVVRLWSTRGAGDDYAEIWSLFLDRCSAKIEGSSSNGRMFPSDSCLAFR